MTGRVSGCLTKTVTSRGAAVDWALERLPLPLETSLPGVLAAGDVRYRRVKRVASAVGQGAIAIQSLHEHPGHVPAHAPPAIGPSGALLDV